MATKDTKTRTSLPVVLEDIAKRELDKPRTRRDIFGLGKKALSTGLGTLVDKSKVADWIIGDDTIERDGMVEFIADELYITNRDISKNISDILNIIPIGGGARKNLDKLKEKFGEEITEDLDELSKDLWKSVSDSHWYSAADSLVDNISSSLEIDDNLDYILDWEIDPLSNPYKPTSEGREIPLEHLSKIYRDKLEEILPLAHSLQKLVDYRSYIQDSLNDAISYEFPEIYDIEEHPDRITRKGYIQDKINNWITNQMRLHEEETGFGPIRKLDEMDDDDVVYGNKKIRDAVTQEIDKAVRTYTKSMVEYEPKKKKKKEDETKRRRLIESATDLARRLAAPPTGTQPRKPPVQQPKIPAQSKIPAPRATMEQPTEQGRGLLNLARMLPAVGRRLPFIAPAATLLRSKPLQPEAPIPVTSAFADIDPRAVEGAGLDIPRKVGGRVYRNYHDYNPRNI